MGIEKEHPEVKLVIPVLYSDINLYNIAKKKLISLYKEIDFESEHFIFDFTDYYNEEMGTPIYRVFLSFKRLIDPLKLVNIKRQTNRIEKKLSVNNKRKVNLDPGYLTLSKFILATTKDQQHRIYTGKGIYEEITLFYRNKCWQEHEWTYPDYRSQRYKEILLKIREIYRKNISDGDFF
ncbi:MAG: DUF4416 family protein [Brevinematia bacterium]